MNRIVKGIALAAGTYVACGLQYRKMDQTEYLYLCFIGSSLPKVWG